MNNLMRVSGILSNCLTTENLERMCPPGTNGKGNRVLSDVGAKKRLFVDLMEYAGTVVAVELGRELKPDEVMLVYNRVKQFLTARGFD